MQFEIIPFIPMCVCTKKTGRLTRLLIFFARLLLLLLLLL